MDEPSVEGAYAAPHANLERPDGVVPIPPRQATRVLGVLLLVASALEVGRWALRLSWGWVPDWIAVGYLAVQIVMGIGLLRFGRKLAVPVLVLVTLAMVRSLVAAVSGAWAVDERWRVGAAVMLAPQVVVGVLRTLPEYLLLIGRPGPGRTRLAIALFVLRELLATISVVYQTLVPATRGA